MASNTDTIIIKIKDVSFSIPPGALSPDALERLVQTAANTALNCSPVVTPVTSVADSVRLSIEELSDLTLEQLDEPATDAKTAEDDEYETATTASDSEEEHIAEHEEINAEIAALSLPLTTDIFPHYLRAIKYEIVSANGADWDSVKGIMNIIFPEDLDPLRLWLKEVQSTGLNTVEGIAQTCHDKKVRMLKSLADSIHNGASNVEEGVNGDKLRSLAVEPGLVLKLHLLLEAFGNGVLAMLVAYDGLDELAAIDWSLLKRILYKLEQRLSNVSVVFQDLDEQVIQPLLNGLKVNHNIVI